ncbi:MAG: flagellar hook-length control protein FliK [Aliihoeflea sp.]|uniref:flagellar hook-length control protein FliK n=1 Tax=Aliihoeflea sp. TaxID=2608088 RepID=UPI0040333CD0
MRLVDMPAMQPPSARTMPGREETSDARGAFDDFLDRDAPSKRTDAKIASKEKPDDTALLDADEAEPASDGLFAATTGSDDGKDWRPEVGDRKSTATPADQETRLRPPGRAHIDWLALRMPRGDDAPITDGTALDTENAAPAPAPLDASEPSATTLQESAEAIPDARLAAAARRDERLIDDRQRPSMRSEPIGASAGDAARTQTPSAEAKPVEPSPREASARDVTSKSTSEPLVTQPRSGPLPDARTGDRSARPVATLSVQTIHAFAASLQGPAQAVLGAIRDEVPELARSAATGAGQPQTAEPMRVLKIQLHPLELGVVTAKLSLQGGEMRVELQAETREATSKLAADSNEIAKALRGLGIEIDRVTVTQQPSTQMQSQGQQGQQGAFERGGERFAHEGGESGRQNGQRGAGNGTGSFEGERNAGESQGSRGVYI